jgi:hypothetical protein
MLKSQQQVLKKQHTPSICQGRARVYIGRSRDAREHPASNRRGGAPVNELVDRPTP